MSLLHLIDDSGAPVSAEIRAAVEGAYRYAKRQFVKIDDAILAAIAESVAPKCSRRRDEIASMDQYALAVMVGEVHAWLRTHPLVEISTLTDIEMEKAAGPAEDFSLSAISNGVLIDQMNIHLSQRDRQILALIYQELDTPADIASELGLTYEAAKKALLRAKERMASILARTNNKIDESQLGARSNKWWKVIKIRRSLS